jgi:hypothetical protein
MSSSNGNAGKKPAPSGGRGGIRTLADINRGPAGFPGAGGSGSDSDEPQEYYTGGEKRYLPLPSPPRSPCFIPARDFAAIAVGHLDPRRRLVRSAD